MTLRRRAAITAFETGWRKIRVQENNMNTMHLSATPRPKSILVATNLNDLDLLLPVAIEQATNTGAMIWLLHVIPPEAYVSIEAGAYPFVAKEKEYRAAEAVLAKVALQLREKNLPCAYEVRRWYPVDEIKGFIREHSVQRLIVGTSGRGKLGKLLIGSVAEQLIRSLDIPVCTVGPHFRPPAPNRPHRILFALSLRHHPEHSLKFAVDLAAGSAAELTVLHVVEQDLGDEGLAAGAMSKIEELLREIQPMQGQPHIRIRSGEPAEEIVAECTASGPQLLVLSAFEASPLSAKFRAGVAYRVIAKAPCPTFTLRSGSKTRPNGNYREFSGVHVGSSGRFSDG
jgi:nucleotide-binding universal stress UspA family protein